MPFPRLYRRTQVVPVSLGTARTDPAYEDSLVEQAIATREAARQQNELEAQRLETIQRRASQYTQTRAQAAERQAQAERQAAQAQAQAQAVQAQAAQAQAAQAQAAQAQAAQAQAAQAAQAQATRNGLSELQTLMSGVNLGARREPHRVLGPSARRRARESSHLRMPNVLELEHDEYGPILPRQLEAHDIHPGDTGDPAADYAFWANQVDVEEQRIRALHRTHPILENYANVRIDRLRTILYMEDNPSIPPGVINAEVEARENIIEVMNNLRISESNLNRSTLDDERNRAQLQTASINAVPAPEIIEKRQAFYALHKKYNQVRKLQGEEEEEIPEELICPITLEYMVDPVSETDAKTKNTYERSNILRTISEQNPYSQPLDPFTRVPIHRCRLVPDKERKAKIAKYKKKMYSYINNYEARLRVSGVRPPESNLASGKKFRKLRKLRQSVKKRKSKQAKQRKQTKQANRRHAKLSKKYKKQYTKRVH